MRSLTYVVLVILTGTAMAMPARAAGSPEAGRFLAQLWCTRCHTVDAAGHGTDAAPPFLTIAERQRNDEKWIRAWLAAPHPPMSNLSLSRGEIDDIVAYLDSLSRDTGRR
jgi:mono/diheme cytochrome c family protein